MSGEARAWVTSTQPGRMLTLLPDPTERKARLLVVACCRVFDSLLPVASRQAVSIGERWADGVGDSEERTRSHFDANHAATNAEMVSHQLNDQRIVAELGRAGFGPQRQIRLTRDEARLEKECEQALRISQLAIMARAAVTPRCELEDIRRALSLLEREAAANLLREIFGNPFRPTPDVSAWRTDTALSLARHIYESRDFSAMPILADALQDAGCDNADILTHCRDPKVTHVRGCWVVDTVLAKE